MIKKRIVILANSRKNSGRCVAGIEVLPNGYGDWIRPVSGRPGEELDESERLYADNSEPNILDVVDLALISAKPHSCQTENWVISPEYYLTRTDSMPWHTAATLVDSPDILWANVGSTIKGENDEIPLETSSKLSNSLYLILVDSLDLEITTDYTGSKRKILAKFLYNGIQYKLSVTDSYYESMLKSYPVGLYGFDKSLLTISLGEPFYKDSSQRYYQYKLVAAIIPRP